MDRISLESDSEYFLRGIGRPLAEATTTQQTKIMLREVFT